jgi:hypothetical protein
MNSLSDGTAITSGITIVYIVGDGLIQTTGVGTILHMGHGLWCYYPTAPETNYSHIAFTFSNASAITASVQVYTADDMWLTQLPSGFSSGSAGAILGAIPSGVTVIPSQVSAGVIQKYITSLGISPIVVIRGDEKPITFNLGTGWPLTGKKVYFIAKSSAAASNSTAIVNREATIIDEVQGIANFTLASSETSTIGSYYAEIEVRNTDNTVPQTARQFTLKIVQDIRQ